MTKLDMRRIDAAIPCIENAIKAAEAEIDKAPLDLRDGIANAVAAEMAVRMIERGGLASLLAILSTAGLLGESQDTGLGDVAGNA